MVHVLKVHIKYYADVLNGIKPFEYRIDDRGFRVGHLLVLMEYDDENGQYTGRRHMRRVTYVLHTGEPTISPHDGNTYGMVILGLASFRIEVNE